MTICDGCKRAGQVLRTVEVTYTRGTPTRIVDGKEMPNPPIKFCAQAELCNDCRRMLGKLLASLRSNNGVHLGPTLPYWCKGE